MNPLGRDVSIGKAEELAKAYGYRALLEGLVCSDQSKLNKDEEILRGFSRFSGRHIKRFFGYSMQGGMRKADFDWAEASKRGFDKKKYERALRDLKKYESVLKAHAGIVRGYWIGMRNGVPYIMVAVEKGKCENPEELIPDKLGKYDVYYIEGTLRLAHGEVITSTPSSS